MAEQFLHLPLLIKTCIINLIFQIFLQRIVKKRGDLPIHSVIKQMIDNRLGCCFTGYRPGKFTFAFKSSDPNYLTFENKLKEQIHQIYKQGTTRFFCGCAMGFDLLSGEIVLELKKEHNDIELVCMVPFIGQENDFSTDWKKRYHHVLNKCDIAAVLSESYYKGCYRRRNFSMVDRSDKVLTYFDGKSGGTAETLKYAKKKGLTIINLAETAGATDEDTMQLKINL